MKSKIETLYLPKGFHFAAGAAGLRTHGSGPDVGLIYSEVPAKVAALFTQNRVKAAPVILSQENLRNSKNVARAVVVNAGNANCATGPVGMKSAKICAEEAAELLGVSAEQVLVASTGVIGVPLDHSRIVGILPKLKKTLSPDHFGNVSRAIMTTDTRPKVASRRVSINGRMVNIVGMAKGAGMINPCLATMLSFIVTDAAVDARVLKDAAPRIADLSFNRISVDGDTSTNDTVLFMANGLAGNRPLKSDGASTKKFIDALIEVAQELAKKIVLDGEGARKFVEIRVENASSETNAAKIARSIAQSSLVKTAIAGADPNWGRILSAVGNAGVDFDPSLVDIYLNGVCVCKKGRAYEFSEAALQKKLKASDTLIRVKIGDGSAQAVFWTCDLTEEYIRINASYRT